MNQRVTRGIILARTNYGEADRIVTVLTPDQGKIRLMARGVRRVKSKLAGGIELFSVSDITYLNGRGNIGTLISSRLETHYGRIVNDIDRVQLGYDLIKVLNKVTEDNPEAIYFDLLKQTFEALDDQAIPLNLIQSWFEAQLLIHAGHTPNLSTDIKGSRLVEAKDYSFDYDNMAFYIHPKGPFRSDQIKVLRLLFSRNSPLKLSQISGLNESLHKLAPLIHTMINLQVTA